uniref:Uncharacterized protein n=1 Tax=Oryza sativa subsp. japonica TaxID=39947 RepID=Q8GSJ5_ORYSJ|nr:hypothetical protein [Oryza sativa Japonica Group]BAC22359.1 hypothetical protein [Oryza sativa Japonica Group]
MATSSEEDEELEGGRRSRRDWEFGVFDASAAANHNPMDDGQPSDALAPSRGDHFCGINRRVMLTANSNEIHEAIKRGKWKNPCEIMATNSITCSNPT